MTTDTCKVDTRAQAQRGQQIHNQITPAVPTIVITPPKCEEKEQDKKPSVSTWMDILKKIQMPHRLA